MHGSRTVVEILLLDMFRRRPARKIDLDVESRSGQGEAPVVPEFAHGHCFLAPQGALEFGSDRREPVAWRPVVSLAARGPIRQVLPSTGHHRPAFYPLKRDRCFVARPRTDIRDSYLAPWVEAIHVSGLIEIGVLPHPERLAIAAWLRGRHAEDVR